MITRFLNVQVFCNTFSGCFVVDSNVTVCLAKFVVGAEVVLVLVFQNLAEKLKEN